MIINAINFDTVFFVVATSLLFNSTTLKAQDKSPHVKCLSNCVCLETQDVMRNFSIEVKKVINTPRTLKKDKHTIPIKELNKWLKLKKDYACCPTLYVDYEATHNKVMSLLNE